MAINTTANWSAAVREYYDRLILMTVYPQLVHTRFAQKRMLPKKMGDTIVFRRYGKLPTVPVPLQDGITPPGASISVTDIKAKVDFYGNFVMSTNQVEMTVEDETLNQSTRLLAENMGETFDEITRDVLASTTSMLACANGVNGATPTELTKLDIDAAVKTLVGNDAQMISSVVKGSGDFGTTPIRPAFFAYMHTDLLDDLEAVSNFVSTNLYAQQGPILDGEWGATGNVRWLYTSIGSHSGATPDVYNNFILGKEAYAVVNLGSETGEFYVESLGSGGTSDPLHQRSTVGWSHPFVARILNDSLMLNLMATHS